MIDAFPLQWPPAWPRTARPEWSRFQTSHSEAMRGLLGELNLLGASNVVISTNLPLRRDGMPYAARRQPDDSGVAVYFTWNGEQQCIPCDKWKQVSDNLHAIELTIGALRGLERWGAKEMVNAAFRGFKALPESVIVTPYTARPWHEVLEVSPVASEEVIRAAYKRLVFKYHPDHGGTVEEFQELQNALKQGVGGVHARN